MKYLILWLGVIGGSVSSVFIRWSTAPSVVLVVYRMVMASLILAPVIWKHREEVMALPRKTLLLCACSGVALGMHFITYFESVKNTSIAASAVLVNLEALFVALASVVVFRKRYGIKSWLSILLAFSGAVIIALSEAGSGGGGENALLGDLMAVLSAMCIGTYTMLGSVCRKQASTTVYTYLVYFTSMVTVLIVTIVGGTPLFGYGAVNFATCFAMTIFCTFMGHSLYSWSLKYFPPAVVSTTRLTDCIFAAVWGLLVFGEKPSLFVVLGGAIILLGVVLYSRTTAIEE